MLVAGRARLWEDEDARHQKRVLDEWETEMRCNSRLPRMSVNEKIGSSTSVIEIAPAFRLVMLDMR